MSSTPSTGKIEAKYIKWKDVEEIIDKFCEVGRAEAIAIREALKLAAAAKELGWRTPSSKSETFILG